MKALYLEEKGVLAIRDYQEEMILGKDDVEVAIKKVGICGSDVHYYLNGRIGSYVVEHPMILGHEASGIVKNVGSHVSHLKVGDRVCMEPGIPNFTSKATLEGMYNLDPDLTFWATPPIHGCLRETVIHPAQFTFKLPENVSLEEGAMIEPLAIGMQTAVKACIVPGDIALVLGAGTIGIMSAVAAIAGGCSKAIITDVNAQKLEIAAGFDGIIPVDVTAENLQEVVDEQTRGWGANIVIEASGASALYPQLVEYCAPGARLVIVGIPEHPVPLDITEMQKREVEVKTVNRYCNVYERAIDLVASGKIPVKKLIGKEFSFDQAVEAFEYVAKGGTGEIKVQIVLH